MIFNCEKCGKGFDLSTDAGIDEMKKHMAWHEEQDKKKAELKKAKDERWNEILEKRKELLDLENKYLKDYGEMARTYRYSGRTPLFDLSLFPFNSIFG